MKIRTRLLITSVVLLAVGAAWLFDWLLQDFRYHYYTAMEESLVDTATILASLVSADLEEDSVGVSDAFSQGMAEAHTRNPAAMIYEFSKTNMNVRVLVMDKTGVVNFDSMNGQAVGEDYSGWRDVSLTLKGEYGARSTLKDKSDPRSLSFYISAPLIVKDEICGVLSVGKPVRSVMPIMNKAKQRLVGMGVVAVAAILVIQVLVSSWVTKPVRLLIDYARSVRDGKNVPRPRLDCSEIGELADAFEEMRDALEGKKYVTGYVQSLTHEMKSPLSAIQGAAELLDEEMPVEKRKRFIDNINSESQRLQELVERMLSLAAVEKRRELVNVEPIDPQELLDDITKSMLPVLHAAKIEVCVSLDANTTLFGEHFLLRQAVANLIQNAIDFSPQNSVIEVRISSNENLSIIKVCDQGEGIPDYALERVFERFYSLHRPDEGGKSSGLGLNFVREIARLHGGWIKVENRDKSGVIATLAIDAKS